MIDYTYKLENDEYVFYDDRNPDDDAIIRHLDDISHTIDVFAYYLIKNYY